MLLRALAFTNARLRPYAEGFSKNIKGATAIEYGLIAGGISIVIVAAVFAVGSDLKGMFSGIAGKMDSTAAKVK